MYTVLEGQFFFGTNLLVQLHFFRQHGEAQGEGGRHRRGRCLAYNGRLSRCHYVYMTGVLGLAAASVCGKARCLRLVGGRSSPGCLNSLWGEGVGALLCFSALRGGGNCVPSRVLTGGAGQPGEPGGTLPLTVSRKGG